MTTRIVSLSDDIRRSRGLERKAWFMGRFDISNLAQLSLDSLLKRLDSHKDVQTVLRLSDKGLSWGEQGFSWRRPWKRTKPFGFVELFALRDVFQESSQPQVLICVVSLVPGTRDFNYHVFAFRLYDIEDVSRFQLLFHFLRKPGELKNTVVRLDSEEISPKSRVAVRPSVEENKAGRSFGDRIRHASKKKDRNLVSFSDPNNNTENADRKADNNQRVQMLRPFSDSDSPDVPQTKHRWKYNSLQPIRRKNPALETNRSVKHPMIPQTVPAFAAAGVKPEDGRSVHVKERNKFAGKSWSDDESERRTGRDFIWTRNILYSDEVGSCREAPYLPAEDNGPPMAQPRRIDQERTITSKQMAGNINPESTISPTQMKSDITPERTSAQMNGKINLERTMSPTSTKGPTSQNVDLTSFEGPSGTVRVYVPEFQSPVAVPRKSLLKSRKDLDPDLETTVVDSERPKKSLSFNPSVLVNGTVGNAFGVSGSSNQPGMTVTIHRVFRHRTASWSESSNSQRPQNLSSARSRVMHRGFSLPNGVSASFDAPKSERIRSTAELTTNNRKSHVRVNSHNGRIANRDCESIDERNQISGEFHKERFEPIGSIPVDVIMEEEDTGYNQSPGTKPPQQNSRAITTKLPQQPKGNHTDTSRSHHRRVFFGRRNGEPPVMYASDSDESGRSRSASRILVGGQSRRQGALATNVAHQIKSSVDAGDTYTGVEAGVTPNGRVGLVDGARARKGEAKRKVVLREGVERGTETGGGEVGRGRSTTVKDRRREAQEGAKQFPTAVTHDFLPDMVERSVFSRRSKSVVDPRRVTPGAYNPDLAPSNGYLHGQLRTRSRSASRPILLSNTASYEDEATRVTVPMGQMAGGQHENDIRKFNRLYLSDQPQNTRLQNGAVFQGHQRNSNFFQHRND